MRQEKIVVRYCTLSIQWPRRANFRPVGSRHAGGNPTTNDQAKSAFLSSEGSACVGVVNLLASQMCSHL